MAQITLPHQLTNGTVADASQVMANFNAIVNVVNGNLGSDNLGTITGSEVTVNDLNGGTAILNNFTKRFQAGTVTFTDVPKQSYASRQITFPVPFPGTPYVLLGVNAGTPDRVYVSYIDASKTGVTIILKNDYANDRPALTIPWFAVYAGAMS